MLVGGFSASAWNVDFCCWVALCLFLRVVVVAKMVYFGLDWLFVWRRCGF